MISICWLSCCCTDSSYFKCFVLSIFFYDCFVVQIMKSHFCMECNMFINAFVFYSCFVHSHFTQAYRRGCLATAVKLLEQLCRGVRPGSYTQNYPNIPVACMNLVASVSDFVHCDQQQVCEVNLSRQAVSISDTIKSC